MTTASTPAGLHTITGVVDRATAGTILPHEHLACDFRPVTGDPDHVLDDPGPVIDDLASFRRAGGTTIVDTTPIDLGRDPDMLRAIATGASIGVVMATGWYHDRFHPKEVVAATTDELTVRMVADLQDGVDDTGMRAGVIGEIGIDGPAASATEAKVLRAAAAAALETGAPVTTHASGHPTGREQLSILGGAGLDPSRVIIGHADTVLDRRYHLDVLREGAWLQFDTAGRWHMASDADRAEAIAGLVADGWAHRLLVSSDRCFRSDLRAAGGAGYAHVLTAFRDRLLATGIEESTLDAIMADNPWQALAW